MKKFLIKICYVTVGLYALLWCLQLTVDFGLRRTNVALYENWNDVTNGAINADLLIVGSSRALRHFDPLIIEKKTGFSSYNLGGSKLTFDIQKIKYNAYLKNNELPKVVIINVDINSLNPTKELFNKTQYLPYYSFGNYNTLKEFDKNIPFEYAVPMYKYRGFYNAIKDGLLSAFFNQKPNDVHYTKGYEPKDIEWEANSLSKLNAAGKERFQYDEAALKTGLELLKKRIIKMRKDSIEVYLIWTPEHISRLELEEPRLSETRVWYEHLADGDDDVHFIDFTKEAICEDKRYFFNSFHLNKKGATLFTGWVSDSISKYSKKF